MSETVTLEIHREKPSEKGSIFIYAKGKEDDVPYTTSRETVCGYWKKFEWWSEIPAPVKPKRFVAHEALDGHIVCTSNPSTILAHRIPTREAAQRIADIYEETTP